MVSDGQVSVLVSDFEAETPSLVYRHGVHMHTTVCYKVTTIAITNWHDLGWSLVFTISFSKQNQYYKRNIDCSFIREVVKTISPQ